jgi:hypothetical protein
MNTIAVLSLVALATTGLALIHETRLRRGARSVLGRLILTLQQRKRSRHHRRDGE